MRGGVHELCAAGHHHSVPCVCVRVLTHNGSLSVTPPSPKKNTHTVQGGGEGQPWGASACCELHPAGTNTPPLPPVLVTRTTWWYCTMQPNMMRLATDDGDGVMSPLPFPSAPLPPPPPVLCVTLRAPDLLQALKIVAQLGLQRAGGDLAEAAVLVVLLPVEEPVGNLVLAWVGHDGHQLLQLLGRQLASAVKGGRQKRGRAGERVGQVRCGAARNRAHGGALLEHSNKESVCNMAGRLGQVRAAPSLWCWSDRRAAATATTVAAAAATATAAAASVA